VKTFHWRRTPSGTLRRATMFSKMRKVAILPTLCTLANGMCGVTAMMCMTRIGPAAQWTHDANQDTASYVGGWLLFLAMLFDVLDGYLARRAKQSSQFGAELDSLCDAVSFGAAPAIMLVQLGASVQLGVARNLFYGISLFFVCCTILRLARFNVTTTVDPKSHRYFQGLPSPAAAGCIASLVILRNNFTDLQWLDAATADAVLAWAAPLAGMSVALLMVSKVKYVHMVNRVLHRRKHFNKLVQVVGLVLMVIMFRELALGFCFWGYALYGPLGYLWTRWKKTAPYPGGEAPVDLQPSTN
jgi:CDP-diacylglycerol--serine O-phosphatidyltransferase